ncbi:MAG: hypothetical protein ACD_10C00763G0002 [uncultured bacterium]|nr:MAG: hypothetical protein ACD_10C00763G0002 [uncultured bacterium]
MRFELFVTQPCRHNNFFGNNSRTRQGHGDVSRRSSQAFPGAPDAVNNAFKIGNIAIGHRIFWQHLYGVALNAVAIFTIGGQFNQLDGGRTDVQPDQGTRLGIQ